MHNIQGFEREYGVRREGGAPEPLLPLTFFLQTHLAQPFLQKMNVEVGFLETGVGQQALMQFLICGDAEDNQFIHSPLHASDAFLAIPGMGNNFTDHRIVVGRDFITGIKV